jgi:hypothetical protein
MRQDLTEEQRLITLNLIDKLHATLLATGQSVNRSLLATIVLSLLLIAATTAMISVEGPLMLGGLRLNIPAWVIPFVGSWLVLAVFMHTFGLAQHETRTRDSIIKLYRDLHLQPENLIDFDCNPLVYPNVFTTVFSGYLLG